MKEYEKLVRIKYDDRLFDIFVDDKHRKYFLEVKIIANKEVYYYLKLKDYFYLDKIYNSKAPVLYNNKIKMVYKVLVSAALVLTFTSPINLVSKNLKLQNVNKYVNNPKIASTQLIDATSPPEIVSSNDQYNDEAEFIGGWSDNGYMEEADSDLFFEGTIYIKDIEELDLYNVAKVDFNDLRKSLEENQKITEDYKLYVSEYIDLLEERMPDIDLRVFNENLKKMEFEIVNSSKLDIEFADGYIDPFGEKTIITLKSEYCSEARKKEVIVHELSHALRLGQIKIRNEEEVYILNIDFRKFGIYGNHFNELFNTIIEQYLLSDDYQNYFQADNCNYDSYEKNQYAFQLLKLMNSYDLNSFLNSDVEYLHEVLSEMGFERLIDLYDIQLNSERNAEVTLINRELLNEYERRIVEMRVEQLRAGGYSEREICKFIRQFPNMSSILEKFSMEDRYGQGWEYVFDGEADTAYVYVEKTEENGDKTFSYEDVFNTNIKVYSNGSTVYEYNLYDFKGNRNPKIYLLASVNDESLNYRFVLLIEDNIYVDIISNKIFTYDNPNTIIKPLEELISFQNLNIIINYDNFIKSDICNNIGLELQNKINDDVSRTR